MEHWYSFSFDDLYTTPLPQRGSLYKPTTKCRPGTLNIKTVVPADIEAVILGYLSDTFYKVIDLVIGNVPGAPTMLHDVIVHFFGRNYPFHQKGRKESVSLRYVLRLVLCNPKYALGMKTVPTVGYKLSKDFLTVLLLVLAPERAIDWITEVDNISKAAIVTPKQKENHHLSFRYTGWKLTSALMQHNESLHLFGNVFAFFEETVFKSYPPKVVCQMVRENCRLDNESQLLYGAGCLIKVTLNAGRIETVRAVLRSDINFLRDASLAERGAIIAHILKVRSKSMNVHEQKGCAEIAMLVANITNAELEKKVDGDARHHLPISAIRAAHAQEMFDLCNVLELWGTELLKWQVAYRIELLLAKCDQEGAIRLIGDQPAAEKGELDFLLRQAEKWGLTTAAKWLQFHTAHGVVWSIPVEGTLMHKVERLRRVGVVNNRV